MNLERLPEPVLVVDDEPFVRKTTVHALTSMGFLEVLEAASGEQALDVVARSVPPVELVILDLNMPDIDGIEVLRCLGEQGFEGDILLFSAEDSLTLAMAETLARGRDLSVIGATPKPIRRELLADLLVRRVDRPEPLRSGPMTAAPVSPQQLEAAIEAGEVVPWFQPIIEAASRRPVGVEMLARWPDSPLGPIYPDAFIPVAESSGLIDRLTFALLEQAVVEQRKWRAHGLDLRLSANVSMDSLRRLDFPAQLADVVASAGGDLTTTTLEVTESRVMEDRVASLDVLLRLRLRRVRLSIDDFGTGHSNLSQLRDLPFDELKIDRSFVHGGHGERRSEAILESTVEVARSLGMSIVAEGVESLDEWRRMEALGCDLVQGWFCSRAMPGSELPAWATAWERSSEELFQ